MWKLHIRPVSASAEAKNVAFGRSLKPISQTVFSEMTSREELQYQLCALCLTSCRLTNDTTGQRCQLVTLCHPGLTYVLISDIRALWLINRRCCNLFADVYLRCYFVDVVSDIYRQHWRYWATRPWQSSVCLSSSWGLTHTYLIWWYFRVMIFCQKAWVADSSLCYLMCKSNWKWRSEVFVSV